MTFRLHNFLTTAVLPNGPKTGLTRRLRRTVVVCLAVELTLSAVAAQDQQKQGADRPAATSRESRPARANAGDRANAGESARGGADRVLKFAEEHHAELAGLLAQLRKAKSPEFDRAVRELTAQIDRIERIRERSPGRYDSELAAWKSDWQIRLLVAKWAMSRDPDLEKQIRELLRGRRDARLKQLQQERDRLTQRLQQVDEQVTKLITSPDQQIDDEFSQLTKRVAAARASQSDNRTTDAKSDRRPQAAKPGADNDRRTKASDKP